MSLFFRIYMQVIAITQLLNMSNDRLLLVPIAARFLEAAGGRFRFEQ